MSKLIDIKSYKKTKKAFNKIVKNKYFTYFVAIITLFFISEVVNNPSNIVIVSMKNVLNNIFIKMLLLVSILVIGYYNQTLGTLLLINFFFLISVSENIEPFISSLPNLLDMNKVIKYKKNFKSIKSNNDDEIDDINDDKNNKNNIKNKTEKIEKKEKPLSKIRDTDIKNNETNNEIEKNNKKKDSGIKSPISLSSNNNKQSNKLSDFEKEKREKRLENDVEIIDKEIDKEDNTEENEYAERIRVIRGEKKKKKKKKKSEKLKKKKKKKKKKK